MYCDDMDRSGNNERQSLITPRVVWRDSIVASILERYSCTRGSL